MYQEHVKEHIYMRVFIMINPIMPMELILFIMTLEIGILILTLQSPLQLLLKLVEIALMEHIPFLVILGTFIVKMHQVLQAIQEYKNKGGLGCQGEDQKTIIKICA